MNDFSRMLELAGVPLNESKIPASTERLDEAKASSVLKRACSKIDAACEYLENEAALHDAVDGIKDAKMKAKVQAAIEKAKKLLASACAAITAASAMKLDEEEELDEKMDLAGTGKAPKTPTDDPKKKDADAKRLPKGDGKDPKLDDDAESPEGVAAKSKEWQAFLKKSDDKDGGKQPKPPKA